MAGNTISPPHTYAQWADILDILKNGRDDMDALEAMRGGTLHWQPEVAQRFLKRLEQTVSQRMGISLERFQKSIGISGGQERVLVQAIFALRRELTFLSQAVNIPAIPEQYRTQLHQMVLAQADSIQESLEDSANKDISGKLSSIIRSNRVNNISEETTCYE